LAWKNINMFTVCCLYIRSSRIHLITKSTFRGFKFRSSEL
jgi:hypothetical protein